MNRDLLYTFDKLTFKREILGEIQNDFNMSLVIDGTSDSFKSIVYSFNGTEVEPNTIVWHEKTNTWWCVKRDKVQRYINDSGNYIYEHNLQIKGAIEWFNSKDLTDCGFYQNEYTTNQFITRLVRLSDVELPLNVIIAPTAFKNKVVDYVKTYENYTLLSALRDFLDGYNMCTKLEFLTRVENNNTYLKDFKIVIISKTGDRTLPIRNINEFDDVREIKTLDSNSFGTTVVSNAENVISNIAKEYPSIGAVRASSNSFRTTAENGVIRLPSKVFKGNWIKMISKNAPVYFMINLSGQVTYPHYYNVNPLDRVGIKKSLDELQTHIPSSFSVLLQRFVEAKSSMFELICDYYKKVGTITLYNGNNVNADNGEIIQGENVPYLANVMFVAKTDPDDNKYVFCSEEDKNNLKNRYQGIAWKRGSNEITGFDAFVPDTGKTSSISWNPTNSDIQGSPNFEICNDGQGNNVVMFVDTTTPCGGHFEEITWIVNYIPMTDLKVKVDNQRTKRDTQLYNQNGKLTDSFALSKLINSYSKEISSDKITKYKEYVDFASVPKCGQLYETPNGLYVVGNVSMDFSENEKSNLEFGYYIETEITMSKAIAVKSLMVNPNTNIRDYGIPQNFNVKRKQVYRDYYELNYVSSEDREWDYFLTPLKTINLSHNNYDRDLTGIIKIKYSEEINGSDTYYYQVPFINFYMCKMAYYILDFNDNNIIGYGAQNVYSGFDITRVFTRQTDLVNTPISYVDSKGKFNGIEIYGVGDVNLQSIYTLYEQDQQSNPDYQDWKDNFGSLFTFFNFIPKAIYDETNLLYDSLADNLLKIVEQDYKKDAIEVPVFEYACQIEDSDDVLIGDNILMQHEDCAYMYSYVVGENLTQEIASTTTTVSIFNNVLNVLNAADLKITHVQSLFPSFKASYMTIKLYVSQQYSLVNGNITMGFDVNIPTNTDIAVFRHSYNTITGEQKAELMFIAKNVTSNKLYDAQTLRLQLNHYKLN